MLIIIFLMKSIIIISLIYLSLNYNLINDDFLVNPDDNG